MPTAPLPLATDSKELSPKAEIECGLIFSSHNILLLSEIDVSMQIAQLLTLSQLHQELIKWQLS